MSHLGVFLLLLSTIPAAAAQEEGSFRAGAARVDITPPEDKPTPMSGYGGRSEPFKGIHDRVHFRAIVLDDGTRQAALISGDVISTPNDFWEKVTGRIEKDLKIPVENVLLCGTHTHAGPHSKWYGSDSVVEKILGAVREAQANLRPARVGVGRGRCNVNINRRARTAVGNERGGWWLGQNPDGPSDKTMHVLKFETREGTPIAFLANYAAHGTTMGNRNMLLSGDHPGATSRFLEKHFDGTVVAAWTSGAAGDQDPIYAYKETFGGRISPVEVLGRIQGESVLEIAGKIRTTSRVRLKGAQKVIRAPGRRNKSGRRKFRPEGDFEFADADPVPIRLSVLMINQTALCGVSGEVLTMIGRRLKERSPFAQTMMLTHANGASGYIPNDEAYGQLSYEIQVTRCKPGVEKLVLDGLLDLLRGM